MNCRAKEDSPYCFLVFPGLFCLFDTFFQNEKVSNTDYDIQQKRLNLACMTSGYTRTNHPRLQARITKIMKYLLLALEILYLKHFTSYGVEFNSKNANDSLLKIISKNLVM